MFGALKLDSNHSTTVQASQLDSLGSATRGEVSSKGTGRLSCSIVQRASEGNRNHTNTGHALTCFAFFAAVGFGQLVQMMIDGNVFRTLNELLFVQRSCVLCYMKLNSSQISESKHICINYFTLYVFI